MHNFFRFPYFLFFLFFITILSYTLILPISQLQTEQVMTSQIRSHIEYLIDNILVLILYFLGYPVDYILHYCGSYSGNHSTRYFRLTISRLPINAGSLLQMALRKTAKTQSRFWNKNVLGLILEITQSVLLLHRPIKILRTYFKMIKII